MTLYLTVRVVLNTAAYDAEVDFWIGSMGARRVGAWDRGLDTRLQIVRGGHLTQRVAAATLREVLAGRPQPEYDT